MRKKLNPLFDPSVPLAGKPLRKVVNALVGLQTKPALAAIDRQTGDEERRAGLVQGRLQSYYDQLAQRQADMAKNAAASTQAGNAAQADIANRAQQVIAQAAQGAQGATQADAALRGDIAGMGNPQQALAQRFAEQAAGSANRAAADSSRAATYNTAGEHYLQGLAGSSGMRGGEDMTDVANRFAQTFRDLAAKKSDIAEKAGGLRADLLTKLRQQGFENGITMEGLNIKREDLANSLALGRARIKETGRHNKNMEAEAARGHDIMRQNSVDSTVSANLRALAKGGGGLTPAQRQKNRKSTNGFWTNVEWAAAHEVPTIRSAIFSNNAQAKKDAKDDSIKPQDKTQTVPWNDDTVRQALRKKGYGPLEIETIIQFLPSHNGGRVDDALAQQLRGSGYGVPKSRRIVKPTPAQTQGASTLGQSLGSFFR